MLSEFNVELVLELTRRVYYQFESFCIRVRVNTLSVDLKNLVTKSRFETERELRKVYINSVSWIIGRIDIGKT